MGSSVITFQYLTYNHKPFCTSNTSWRFSINSTLLKENPLSTDACQWERVKTSLQTSQRFLYSLFLCMKSARNASVPFPFWLKIRKASLCWLWSMNHIEQHIFFLHLSAFFDYIQCLAYTLSTNLQKYSIHFPLLLTIQKEAHEAAQQETVYFRGHLSWIFYRKATSIDLQYFVNFYFLLFGKSVDLYNSLGEGGSLIASSGRSFL